MWCITVCLDLNTSHSVSMLETIRAACLCLKLATSCNNNDNTKKKCSFGVRGRVDCVDQRLENNGLERIKLNDDDWKDNKECCSDEDEADDADDDEDDDGVDGVKLSHKDLFRMATLGGATGIHHSALC